MLANRRRQLWQQAQAVCFDVDSTVCLEEGIDMLAKYCGVEKQVKDWTTRAMDGNVKFEDALAARLDIIKPSRTDIQQCLLRYPPLLSPGVKSLFSSLQQQKKDTFLVSGGFRLMIQPVAEELSVPEENVFANTIWFDSNGKYKGFDPEEFTSRDFGKAKALEAIQKQHGYANLVMVGDGMTDMQAKPPANLVIGYGGVVERAAVREKADWFVTDFKELV